jgi:hypothetical protein
VIEKKKLKELARDEVIEKKKEEEERPGDDDDGEETQKRRLIRSKAHRCCSAYLNFY